MDCKKKSKKIWKKPRPEREPLKYSRLLYRVSHISANSDHQFSDFHLSFCEGTGIPPDKMNIQERHERRDALLLKLMAQEIERGNYRPGSTFREESEEYVFENFRRKCPFYARIYSNRLLKSLIRCLRSRYLMFSEVMNKPHLYWRKKDNVVWGNEELLREKYKFLYDKDRGVYTGEVNFDLMCEVFESGVKFLTYKDF